MTIETNADLVEMAQAALPDLSDAELNRLLAWANARRDAAVAAYKEQQRVVASEIAAALDQMALITDPRDAEIARLRSALETAANGFDEIIELNWDDAYVSETAIIQRNIARAALEPQPPEPSR